jgi:hypothetical protein
MVPGARHAPRVESNFKSLWQPEARLAEAAFALFALRLLAFQRMRQSKAMVDSESGG